VHSVASSLMGRPEQGLKDLINPAIGTNYDSQLWKALAYARQGKWAEAREKFKNAEFAITSLPIELQRILISEAMRCSLEVKDYSGAAKRSDDLDVVGLPSELKGAIAVLRGRLAEALGHDKDALGQYRIAIGSTDRAAAAEAKLLEIVLRQRRDEISQTEVLRELETLSVMWRGDAVEVSAANHGADLPRDRTLRRILCGGTDRDQAATQFRANAASAGCGGGAVLAAVSEPEGRRPSAGRRARDVLRVS
jgi:hypothetical protein